MASLRPYNGFSGEQRERSTPWQKRQYALGLRIKPTVCLACGGTGGVVGHWEDYTEPFGDHNVDLGLCHRCHMMAHCRFRYPQMFERYCERLRAGYRFPALAWSETRRLFVELGESRLPSGEPRKVREAVDACWFDLFLWDQTWKDKK